MAPVSPHLPLGREPGSMTARQNSVGRFWEITCAVVGSLMFLAGAFVAMGGRGPGFDRQEELYGGIFFASFGLLAVFVALKMRNARIPLRRTVAGVALAVSPEARVGGAVDVDLTIDPGTTTDGLEVGLVCVRRMGGPNHAYTQYGRVPVANVREKKVSEQWQPVASGRHFAFTVPPDAPASSEGTNDADAWRVAVRRPLRFRRDAMTVVPIWVVP